MTGLEIPVAREPAEARGVGRDDVRLLVTCGRLGTATHAHFRDLPCFLQRGDLLVLNASATIPAALRARHDNGETFALHVSTRLPADLYVVEPRNTAAAAGEAVSLEGGATATILAPYRRSRRLWIASFDIDDVFGYLARWGKPIAYPYVAHEWPIEVYQTVYAQEPGSAEMPSAGRPFTRELLDTLRAKGVGVATLTLHTGVASLERDEPPYEERYEITAETAEAVASARRAGGRVIAVGTTVARALESSTDGNGRVVASRGWTDLIITPEHRITTVDGILTGFHEPTSTHLAMLEAIAGREHVERAYAEALKHRYLWHEFGDIHVILREEC